MCHEMDFTLLQFDKEADTKSENSYGRGTRRFWDRRPLRSEVSSSVWPTPSHNELADMLYTTPSATAAMVIRFAGQKIGHYNEPCYWWLWYWMVDVAKKIIHLNWVPKTSFSMIGTWPNHNLSAYCSNHPAYLADCVLWIVCVHIGDTLKPESSFIVIQLQL